MRWSKRLSESLSQAGSSDILGPLYGRDDELRVLHACLREGAGGHGGAVVVEGGAGSGKSRFVVDAAVAAASLGFSGLVASAAHDGQPLPFPSLVKSLVEEEGSPPIREYYSSISAREHLWGCLEATAKAGPVFFALDDIHTAHPSTVSALAGLAARTISLPIVWMVTGQPTCESSEHLIAALRRRAPFMLIELPSLGREAVAALLTQFLGANPDDQLRVLAERASGNPQLLMDLIDGLCRSGAVEVSEGLATLAEADAPSYLDVVAKGCLSRVSRRAGVLLQQGATLEQPFLVQDLAELANMVPEEYSRALNELISAGYLRSHGSLVGIRYPLLEEAFGNWTSASEPSIPPQRRQMVSAAIPRNGHGSLATTVRSETPLGGSQGAARQALRPSLDTAPPSAPPEPGVAQTLPVLFSPRAGRGEALLSAGPISDAVTVAECFVADSEVSNPIRAGEMRLRLSSLRLLQGESGKATTQAEIVLGTIGLTSSAYDEADFARILAALGQCEFARAMQLGQSVLAGRDRPGGDIALAAAFTALAYAAWLDARIDEAVSLFEAALVRCQRCPPRLRIHAALNMATAWSAMGQFGAAHVLVDQTAGWVTDADTLEWAPAVPLVRARLHLVGGQLSAARDAGEEGLRMAEQTGAAELIRFGHWVLAAVCIHTGDLSRAASHVSSYQNKARPAARTVLFATLALTAARLTAARLGPAAAGDEVGVICAGLAHHKDTLVMDPAAAAFLVSVSLSAYQRQQAQYVVDVAESMSASNAGVAHLAAAAAHARGLLDREPLALKTAALRHIHPWARALALEDLGGGVDRGDLAVSRDHFAEASAAYEQLGAGHDAARARRRSADLAEPGRGKRRRFAPVAGWSSLTDTERKVSDHVVDGLSNPQIAVRMFISRHTVDFHLRQVYRKLDVHSRVELTRLALETKGSGTRGTA